MAQTRSTEHLDKGAYLILGSAFHRCEWFTLISSSGGLDNALWKRSPLKNKQTKKKEKKNKNQKPKKHSFFFFPISLAPGTVLVEIWCPLVVI